MRKNILLLAMTLIMAFSVVGCGNTNTTESEKETAIQTPDTPKTVTINSFNGNEEEIELEIPYNPQRIAVLDMAMLDIIDYIGVGEQVVGMAKGSTIDYLSDYNNNESIANVGTVKEADLEALMACEPDVIFIGGRLVGSYDALAQIAPVVYLPTDYEVGLMESVKNNVTTIATMFGLEEKVNSVIIDLESRVASLKEVAAGKTAVVGLVTSSSFSTLGNDSRCSMIGTDIGFTNLAADVDSTHGNEASFELLPELNPDYIFVLDRDSAIGSEGAQLAKDVMNNELVKKTSAYKNEQIVYLTPTVWYLAEGGLTAMDIMLQDLETALLSTN